MVQRAWSNQLISLLRKTIVWSGVALYFQIPPVLAQAPAYKDIVYASVNGKDLKLDIYLPAGVKAPVLLVWVHGGAWRSGWTAYLLKELSQHGLAIASLVFRQLTVAGFPFSLHDIISAIPFLSANPSQYRYK